MSDMFQWLLDSVTPIAKRLLASLGIGWVSFEGYSQLVESLKSSISSAWGAIGSDAMTILSISGVGVAIGIIIGAYMFKATQSIFSRLGKII